MIGRDEDRGGRAPTGREDLGRVLDEADALPSLVPSQIGGRPCWQRTWADHHPSWSPWVVTVRSDDGRLQAMAALAHQRQGGVRRIVALGHTSTDAIGFPATSTDAAHRLADTVADHLLSLRGDWYLHLHQLVADDPTGQRLTDRLGASTVPGWPCPTTRFHEGRDLAAYTSRNYRAQARHKWNRLVRAGTDPRVELATRPDEVAGWLEAIEPTWRRRDTELGGRSRLDDPREAAFVRDLVMRHAAVGQVEVAVLVADGEVAAYSVSFLDRTAYRQWNKHHDSRWADYRPGQVLDARLLERVLADEAFDEFDWMAGDEPYKHRAATDVVDTVHVHAGRGLLASARRWAPPVRARVRAEMRARPGLEQAWTRAKVRGRRLGGAWRSTP